MASYEIIPRSGIKDARVFFMHTDDSGAGKYLAVLIKPSSIEIYSIREGQLITSINQWFGYWDGLDNSGSPSPVHGNSLLIKISRQKYMFIGTSVYTFTSREKIKYFASPVSEETGASFGVGYSDNHVFILRDEMEYSISEFSHRNHKLTTGLKREYEIEGSEGDVVENLLMFIRYDEMN